MKHLLWLASSAFVVVALGDVPHGYAAGKDAHFFATVVQTPSYEDQAMLFQAVDAGNLPRIKQHFYFTKSFMASSARMESRINLEFADQAGNTPLIRAAMHPDSGIVNFLLDNGANINAVNAKYETALIAAYNNGHFDVAKLLLARGADDPYHAAQLIRKYEAQARHAAVQPPVAEAEAGDHMVRNALLLGGGAAAAAGGALALGGGGGGGGGGGSSVPSTDCGAGVGIHPENCNSASFTTSEAQAQEGVLAMKDEYAIAHGYDGRIYNRDGSGNLLDDSPDGHVLIAQIDTGVDLTHSDLGGNLRTDLAVTCTVASGCVAGGQDIDGHGTNVAGIMVAQRNNTGMHGVAPEAHLIPIAAIISGGSTTAAFKYANNNGAQAINNSWGYVYSGSDLATIPIVNATGPVTGAHPGGSYSAASPGALRTLLTTTEDSTTDLVQLQAAVAAHRLIVFSVGNSALTQPGIMAGLPLYFQGVTAPSGVTQPNYDTVNAEHYDWSRNWVASISLADNGGISSFSHQCGVAKNWCLAAPGEIANTTQLGGGYEANNGTSFSAPNVTGAIAVMLGAFPQLDPEEVLQVLFDTATDLGTAGVDDVYGHGLVNLQAATDPTIGGWTLSASGSGAGASSSSFGFGDSGFGLAAPFGNVLAQNNLSLMFQDGYNKDYTIPLSIIAGGITRKQTVFDRFDAFAENAFDTVASVSENTVLGFSAGRQGPIPDKTSNIPLGKFLYQSSVPMGADGRALSAFNYRTNMAEAMQPVGTKNLTVSHALQNPYLHLVGSASGTTVGYQSGKSRMRVAAYSGTMNGDTPEYNYRFGNEKNVSGVISEMSYASDHGGVAIENGVTVEENSFLGSEASGAFGVDRSSTYYTGISGRIGLAEDVALIGNAHLGLTDVAASGSSIFTDFGSVMTSAFALGAEFSNVASEQDTLGILMSQPLKVMRGSASLALPVDVAADKSVVYRNQRLNLAPSARELDFESYYHLAAGDMPDLSVNAIFRMNPDNDNTAPNDFTMLTKYKLGF